MAEILTETRTLGRAAAQFSAFWAQPPASKRPSPGLVLVHTIRGLSEHERSLARAFAGVGFVVVAPDLYSHQRMEVRLEDAREVERILRDVPFEGTFAPGFERALAGRTRQDQERLRQAARVPVNAPDPNAVSDLKVCVSTLAATPGVDAKRIVCMGFSMGGGYTWTLATVEPRVRAGVVFYGRPLLPYDQLDRLAGAMLAVHAGEDTRLTDLIPEIEQEMAGRGRSFTHITYPGVHHGFQNPWSSAYHRGCAKDAMMQAFTFLKESLGELPLEAERALVKGNLPEGFAPPPQTPTVEEPAAPLTDIGAGETEATVGPPAPGTGEVPAEAAGEPGAPVGPGPSTATSEEAPELPAEEGAPPAETGVEEHAESPPGSDVEAEPDEEVVRSEEEAEPEEEAGPAEAAEEASALSPDEALEAPGEPREVAPPIPPGIDEEEVRPAEAEGPSAAPEEGPAEAPPPTRAPAVSGRERAPARRPPKAEITAADVELLLRGAPLLKPAGKVAGPRGPGSKEGPSPLSRPSGRERTTKTGARPAAKVPPSPTLPPPRAGTRSAASPRPPRDGGPKADARDVEKRREAERKREEERRREEARQREEARRRAEAARRAPERAKGRSAPPPKARSPPPKRGAEKGKPASHKPK